MLQVCQSLLDDATLIAAASRSSLIMSRFLIRASTFAFSRISAHTVSIPIFVGMMTSIPYGRANNNIPVSFRLVILYANKTHGSSSTHFPFAECRFFFSELTGESY